MNKIEEFRKSTQTNYFREIKQIDISYVQELYLEVCQKVNLFIIKTKIYQIIKGLIILFIKIQFSNQI